MLNNMKILILNDHYEGGVYFYRILEPFYFLAEKYDLDIYMSSPSCIKLDTMIKFDVIVMKNCVYNTQQQILFWRNIHECKEKGIKIIYDVDDYWNLPAKHPLKEGYDHASVPMKIITNIRLADLVWVTTPKLKEYIQKYNDNVVMVPNAIDPSLIDVNKTESDKIRIGIAGSSTHAEDYNQIRTIFKKLGKRYIDKVQIVLCGYSDSGKLQYIDQSGNIMKEETVSGKNFYWQKLKNDLSGNGKVDIVTIPSMDICGSIKDKTLKPNEYFNIFNDIDILMAPLEDNEFNLCKSNLKFIEAGFTNTAIVASNIGEYSLFSNDINCILCGRQDWIAAIKDLVDNPEKLKFISDNLHDLVVDEYNLEKINKIRWDSICNISI